MTRPTQGLARAIEIEGEGLKVKVTAEGLSGTKTEARWNQPPK